MTGMTEFWAKSPKGQSSWHPLIHHLIDTGAAALTILDQHPAPWPNVAPRSLAFLASLHDIGKATRNFQAQRPDLWPLTLGPLPASGYLTEPRHEASTWVRLTEGPVADWLQAKLFPDWSPSARTVGLRRAVAFHHGRPRSVPPEPLVTCKVCDDVALKIAQSLFELIQPAPIPRLPQAAHEGLAWWLAGLTTLADWIASSAEWFPPSGDAPLSPQAAWEHARRRASRAIQAAGLEAFKAGPGGVAAVFPAIREPSPVQRWADQVALPEGPKLAIIEDVTGAGKTEAALLLAHRLMRAGDADGVFFALPTMATANAMHARLAVARGTFFAAGDAAPLVLAHGRTGDMRAFGAGGEEGAAREADAWLASDRRRCFLAAMGAGTVDQALLAVLPVRHAMLRLFGLSRRVLVVDEAHAYDAYMRTELTTLLEFQAAMGGSAILLSATLTRKARGDFATAFRKGLGAGTGLTAALTYPLATIVSRDAVRETPCDLRPALARRVAIRRIGDVGEGLEAVLDASRRGAAVAWIRNTVGDVMAAADALRAAGADPLVFHARFAMGDRLAIEDEVLRRFGKESTPELRRGRVVVASQVLESSLDVCFDAMVTDLAPIDLLIQRAGRLWRHARGPRPLPGPELLLLSPEAPDDAPPEWPGAGFAGTARVYPHRAVLWRSARAALDAGAIDTPGNLRALVEAAYHGFTPPGLEDDALRAEGKESAAAGQARFNLLRVKDAYGEGKGPWPTDHKVPTRLGEPSFTFRLAQWEGGTLRPMVEAAGNAWSLSEISLPERLIKAAAPDEQAAAALAALQAGWREWEAEIPVLILRPDDGGWVGRAVDGQGRQIRVTYRRDRGLATIRG